MIPKGKLLALVLAFAAVGGLAATGAFTTVEADRTADVNVAGDGSALLTLEEGGTNPEYVTGGGTDQIEFDISAGSNSGSGGINLDALTEINGSINVTNNGNNAVDLGVTLSGSNDNLVSFIVDGTDLTSSTVSLNPGVEVSIDVIIDTTDQSSLSNDEEIINEITFEANSQ